MKSPRPESDTSFAALNAAPEAPAVEYAVKGSQKQDTDFATLNKSLAPDLKPYQYRSVTDLLIDGLTPVMIFIMVYSVMFFLLEVRFIYSEVHDKNLKMVAFFFIIGIVALNRLVAREGREESFLYVVVLAGTIGFYTLVTTSQYDVGSFAVTFLNRPWIATGFNMMIIAIIWWTTNRLIHECSIDENKVAGDVGILTGTAMKWQKAIQRVQPPEPPRPKETKRQRRKDHLLEMMQIEGVDPTEWKPPEKQSAVAVIPPTASLPKRHPGMSILYYSVPVMIIFSLGLPVLMAGGERWVRAGHLYVGIYTVTALFLLMLTSLGGLREYFRSRRVYFPAEIGWFWVGIGIIMIAMVCVGALQLPKPAMPPMAHITEHLYDPFLGPSRFQLQSRAVTAAEALEQARVIEYVGQGVLILFAVFLGFWGLRLVGNFAALLGRYRDWCPAFIVRFFDALDRFLLKVIRVPSLPKFPKRIRIAPEDSISVRFHNPMEGAGLGSGADVPGHIAYAYDALCALAEDLGVPRHKDQTPYEFINAFPRALKPIKEEAMDLTDLYVRSAYSSDYVDETVLDRLRKFWVAYDQTRQRVIR